MPNHVAFDSTNGRPPAAKRRSKKDKRRRSKRTSRKKDGEDSEIGPKPASNDRVQHDTEPSRSSPRNEKRSFELFIPGITGRARCMHDTLVANEAAVVVGETGNNELQPSEDRKLSIDTSSLPPTLTTVSSSSDVSSMVVLPPEKPPESRQQKRRTDSPSPDCGIGAHQQSEQHQEEEEAAQSDSDAGQSMSSLKLFLCVTSSSSRHTEASSTIVLADQRSNQSGPELGMPNFSPSYNAHRRQGNAEALSYASGQEQTFAVGQNLCLRCFGELRTNLWSHSPLRNQQRLGGPGRIDPPENAFKISYDHRRPDPVGQLVHVRDLTYNQQQQQQQLRPAFADPPESICHSQPPDPPGSVSITSICDDRPRRVSSSRQTLESIRGGRPPLIPKNPTTTLNPFSDCQTRQDSPKSSVTNSPSIITLFVPNIMHPLHDSLDRSNHTRHNRRSSKSRESYSDKIICCEMSRAASEGSSSSDSLPSLGTLSSSLDSFTSTDFPSTAKLLAQTMPESSPHHFI